jgi:hypothetical protein
MIKNRCGVDLGHEVMNEARKVLEVHDFWQQLSPLNVAIKKALKSGFQKDRVVIVESEAMRGLRYWVKNNKVKVVYSPTVEQMRSEISNPGACFFLMNPDEYEQKCKIKGFVRIADRLPRPIDLSTVDRHSQLEHEAVLAAFSEVNELPHCARLVSEIGKSTLVNLVVLLVLMKNYTGFCSEAIFCTGQNEECRKFFLSYSRTLRKEFFDLVKSHGIYYPVSVYTKNEFPEKHHYIDLNSYVIKFGSPIEMAIFLHDAYQMGTIIYPGYSSKVDVANRPDAYLLDYIYPLEKSITSMRISGLVFLSGLKTGKYVKNFLDDVGSKLKFLPLGEDVGKHLLDLSLTVEKCYEHWHLRQEEIALLYAIWKLKKILNFSYQRTKIGLSKIDLSKARAFLERINACLYEYKDFLERDWALELGISVNFAKNVMRNLDEASGNKGEVEPLEYLLCLQNDAIREKLRTATVCYPQRKIAASRIWEDILAGIKQLEKLDHSEIGELLPYVASLLDPPVFGLDDKAVLLETLRDRQMEQGREIINFIRKLVIDELLARPSLSCEIDGMVNQWETGNPLGFYTNRIREKIVESVFDPKLFDQTFKIFCSINVLKLFRREPSKFFDYQYVLDQYIGLQIKKSGKNHFDIFQPITSVFDSIKKLQDDSKKVILLIFDGLGFLHFYLACLELSRKETKTTKELCQSIVNLFQTGRAPILSSCLPTLTGVNHIALFFGERLLFEDSFLIRATDDNFISDSPKEKATVFNIIKLNEQDKKLLKPRLEECNLQKPTDLWTKTLGNQKKGLLISANSERSLLSYLLKNNADFEQVDSYTGAIDAALSDRTHDLVISQVNLMDAFLHGLKSSYPPAIIDDVVNGYWEVYLDLLRNIIYRISKALTALKRQTVVIITADHGMALGRTTEFKQVSEIFDPIKEITCQQRFTSELVSTSNVLVGACIPGGRTSKRFLSIFVLKKGLDMKDKIGEAMEAAERRNDLVFEDIKVQEDKRNLTIKPDFLVFPINATFARETKGKYYGGIHGGISMCEMLIPFVKIER